MHSGGLITKNAPAMIWSDYVIPRAVLERYKYLMDSDTKIGVPVRPEPTVGLADGT